VLLDEHGGDESQHRGVAREDADDVGPPLDLGVHAHDSGFVDQIFVQWVIENALKASRSAGGQIVAHYYDIESGTRSYAARGSGGLAGFDIAIPRDGGLQDLLADAARRPARFDR
jgi:hypothetical protein